MTYDLLIIGGGISGLGLAHLGTRRGLRTLLLESARTVGGCIATQGFPEAPGFWVEGGAHTCYNSYGHLLDIIADLGLSSQLAPKGKVSFKVLHRGRLRSVLARLHPLELLVSLPRLAREPKAGRSVADYYSRVLGRRNYQDLFGPAFNAVICQPADDFPADLLFRRKPRRKELPRSFTLPRGLSSLVEAMAAQPGLEVITAAPAVGLAPQGDGFEVISADGRGFAARRLALAVPPDSAAALLAGGYPALAGLLGEIAMAEIDSVSVAVPRSALPLPSMAGIIAPNDDFYAVVSRDYLDDPKQRGFTFHFRPERLSAEAQLGRIGQVLAIDPGQVTGLARTRNRLPALRAGHVQRVERIDQALKDTGLLLTGNYFLGVSLEDCLTRSATEAQRLG
jgi:protoporphyrinogen/coproporphyrinogen III oxidase